MVMGNLRGAVAQGRQQGDYKGVREDGARVGSSLAELSIEGRERVGVVEVGSRPGLDAQLPVFLLCPLLPCISPPVLPIETTGKQVATVETVEGSHKTHIAISPFY